VLLVTGCGGGGRKPSARPANAGATHTAPLAAASARAPSGHERSELIAATRAFIRSHPDCCSRTKPIEFVCARVSTVSSRWALLVMSEALAHRKVPLAVTLHHGGFTTSGLYTTHWTVDAFASGDLNVPPKVMSELGKAVLRCATHSK
jgi:hypothetical protein